MWRRMIRWLVAGLALVLIVGVFGGGVAGASNSGNNGRLVYQESTDTGPVELSPGNHVPVRAPEIYTMNPDGSDVRRLTFDAGQYVERPGATDFVTSENRSPVWSPKGNEIAYVHLSPTEVYSIRLMDPEGKPLGVVTSSYRLVWDLSWSPDGEQLSFTGYGPDAAGITRDGVWAIRADGTQPRLLQASSNSSDGLWGIGDLQWSPAGDLIAFAARPPTSVERGRFIYVIAPDGTGVRRVEGSWNWSGEPEWSPDGTLLYYSSAFFDYASDYRLGSDIWRASVSGGSHAERWAIPGNEQEPTVSPDGSDLLYVSDLTGREGLWSLWDAEHISGFSGSSLDWQPIQGSFWDDERSVFLSDIEWMAANGITKGCNPPANDKYCPDGAVTRGQMAAFLVRALGLTDNGGGDLFIDDDGSVFESDSDRLGTAGITKGCNPPANNRFCPNSKVTRAQMAAFLVRALGYTGNGEGDLFVDDDDSIFESDIDRLGTAGVTRGCNPPTNDRYCPNGHVTRGQMAAFLHRALG